MVTCPAATRVSAPTTKDAEKRDPGNEAGKGLLRVCATSTIKRTSLVCIVNAENKQVDVSFLRRQFSY